MMTAAVKVIKPIACIVWINEYVYDDDDDVNDKGYKAYCMYCLNRWRYKWWWWRQW